MSLPTVTPEYLRGLADLVEKGEVSVIKCELRPKGVILGVVEPRLPAPPCKHEWSVDEQGTRRCIGCGTPR